MACWHAKFGVQGAAGSRISGFGVAQVQPEVLHAGFKVRV